MDQSLNPNPTEPKQLKGAWAEDAALQYLLARGYRLLARNSRTPFGEIDLWMKKGDAYVAVEVKQRKHTWFGGPAEAITRQKLDRIKASVLWLLARDDEMVGLEAILIYGTKAAYRLEHLII